MSEDRRAHWLPPNEANRYPRRLITFDTESQVEVNSRREQHRFRLAVASFDLIDPETLQPERTEWFQTTSAVELWDWIGSKTRSKGRTVAFAHNLGFDFRVAAGLTLLPDAGWEIKRFSLDSYRAWVTLAKGSRRLILADTSSVFPVGLNVIGKAVGISKVKLPPFTDGDDAWFARCRRDVEITREAVLRYTHWLETEDMGSWRTTGPAQADAAYRHRFMPAKQLLVHDHTPAIDAERKSAYTGRAEAWRHGQHKGYLYEWDYKLAYAHLAQTLEVPIRFVGHTYNAGPERLQTLQSKYAVLVDAEISTEVPTVPTNGPDGILWPVGQFDSTLWDTELQLLLDNGGTYTARRAWLYEKAPALSTWADWIIGQLEDTDSQVDPLIKIMLKGWSRSLIGRFGLRYPKLVEIATAPTSKIELKPHNDEETGELRWTWQIGHQVLEQEGADEGRNSIPAVMAYIMAASRRQLWETMTAVGLENLAHVDTDAVLVTQQGHDRLKELTGGGQFPTLAFKKRMAAVEILAPRQIIYSRGTKVAGLAKNSQRTGKRSWEGEYWESARGAIRRGRPDQVIVEKRVFTLKATDRRRRHRTNGHTIPYRLTKEVTE